MRRTLATAGTVLLLALPLTGCGDDDSDEPGADPAPSAEAAGDSSDSGDSGEESPAVLENLPEAAPDLPTERVPAFAGGGAALDACAVLSPGLVQEVFDALPGQAMPQPSSLGDPDAADCYYFGGEAVIAAQATTRADEDLPEASYTYDGIPGAVPVPGADRGWAVIFPGQDGEDTLVSGLIVVQDGRALNLAISITGHPYDTDTLLDLAEQLLEGMSA